jgi:hypothetical protein
MGGCLPASVRLVIENMIDVIRHPAQIIDDFMRSPFKFSNDAKQLVATVPDSTPEVNSVFDRVDKFVLEETTNLDNFLEVINHLHSSQTSYHTKASKTRLVANNQET